MKTLRILFFLILSTNALIVLANQSETAPFSAIRDYVNDAQPGNLTCSSPEHK